MVCDTSLLDPQTISMVDGTGIYFTLFIICLFVFNDGKGVNKVILYTMCVMFLLSTAHLVRSISEPRLLVLSSF